MSIAKASAVIAAALVIGAALAPVESAAAEEGFHQVNPGSDCTDVFVLGARGSGQDINDSFGLGPEVYLGVLAYANEMPGYDVGFDFVSYQAQAVDTLLTPTTHQMFFDSIDDGVAKTLDELKVRAAKCEDEHYVLAGYSQGAMVMHRVMAYLTNTKKDNKSFAQSVLPRIDGVLAIADGDYYPGQGGLRYGSASDSNVGVWWVAKVVKKLKTIYPSTKKFPTSIWPLDRYHAICQDGDLVCDNGNPRFSLLTAATTHGTVYKPGETASSDVVAAAKAIAATSKQLRPKTPATCDSVPRCTPFWVGQTWTEYLAEPRQLVASLEWITAPIPGAVLDVTFRDASLSFTPMTAGTYNWGVRVTFEDGTTNDVSGVLIAYDYPPQALYISSYTTGYVFPLDSAPYSTLTLTLIKLYDAARFPNSLQTNEYALSIPYRYGDVNGNGQLDVGEAWTYSVSIPWNSDEPGNSRTRTILVNAIDPRVPNYQIPETQMTIRFNR